jgi:hypothetical protein
LATGNNLRTGGDMASRTIWIRLDPDMPHPEARTGFSIPNLDTWILDPLNQATVLWHLLILILDWTASGARPSPHEPAMRQFTRWAQHPGLLNTTTSATSWPTPPRTAARRRRRMARLPPALAPHNSRQVTAHDLRCSAAPDQWGTDPWQGLFPTDPRGNLPTVKSLGKRLTGQIGRWRGDIVLRSVTDDHGHGRAYWVERLA